MVSSDGGPGAVSLYFTATSSPGDILDVLTFTYNNCQLNPTMSMEADPSGVLNVPAYYNGQTPTQFNLDFSDASGAGTTNACCQTGINSVNENKVAVSVYPNPFNDIITLNFTLAEDANVSLSIKNILGQNIYEASYGDLSSGSFNREINMATIESGVYFLTIYADGEQSTIKLVKE